MRRRLLSILMIATALSACSSRVQPKDPSAYTASFVVDQIAVSSNTKSVEGSQWQLPQSRALGLKACVKDRAYFNPVVGQDFTVEGATAVANGRTDENGCFVWSEKIQYNYVAPETYITLNRVIAPSSGEGGRLALQLAVDPWQDGPDAVKDLRYDQVPQNVPESQSADRLSGTSMLGQSVLTSFGFNDTTDIADLVVTEVEYSFDQTVYTQQGARFSLLLAMRPKLYREGLDGAANPEDLMNGQFRLQYALVQKLPGAQGDQDSVLVQSAVTVDLQKGLLSVHVPIELAQLPSPQALFEIRYHLDPLEGPSGLGTEDGVVQISGLSGSGTGPSVPVAKGDGLLDFVAAHPMLSPSAPTASPSPAVPSSAPVSCTNPLNESGFVLTGVSGQSAGYPGRNSEQMNTSASSVFTACIVDPVGFKPIVNYPLAVNSTDDTGKATGAQNVTTDATGCVRWTETRALDWTQAEHYIPLTVQVHADSGQYQNIDRSFKLSLDPWVVGTTTWDCRAGAAPVNPTATAERIQLNAMSFQFTGRDLELDRTMNLQLKRHYQLKLQPVIFRDSQLVSGGSTQESIADGQYKLRVVLLSDPLDARADASTGLPRTIAHDEMTVTAQSGLIVATVTLPFDFLELPLVASRNTLIVEIAPLDSGLALQKAQASGPFQTLDDSGSVGLTPSTQDLDSLVRSCDATLAARASGQSPLELYEAYGKTKEFSPAELQDGALSEGSLEMLIESGKKEPQTASELCGIFYRNEGKTSIVSSIKKWFTGSAVAEKSAKRTAQTYESCLKNPYAALSISKLRFVDQLTSPVKEVSGDTFSFNSSASFGRCDVTNQDAFKGQNTSSTVDGHAGVDAGAGTGKALPIQINGKLGVGYSLSHAWYTAHDVSTQQSHSNCITLSQGRTISVDLLKVSAEALVDNCLLVEKGGENRFYCSAKGPVSSTIGESYYYASQMGVFSSTYSSSPLRDPRQLDDRPWTRVIRGAPEFQAFQASLQKLSAFYELEPDVQASGNAVADWFSQAFGGIPLFSDGDFPGMLN